jgi:NADH:ubiquinone oxidoreductase subunit D
MTPYKKLFVEETTAEKKRLIIKIIEGENDIKLLNKFFRPLNAGPYERDIEFSEKDSKSEIKRKKNAMIARYKKIPGHALIISIPKDLRKKYQ